jgi:hypothetical protein
LVKKPSFSATTTGSESEVLLRAMRIVVVPDAEDDAPDEEEDELQPTAAIRLAVASAERLRRRGCRMSSPFGRTGNGVARRAAAEVARRRWLIQDTDLS